MKGMRILVLSVAIAILPMMPAGAQTANYDIKTINFDLWCQEQANLPADRCDKRLPEDEAAYEVFRAKIEKFELSHLKDKNKEGNFDSSILHNDPVDEPPSTQYSKRNPATQNNP